MRNHKHVKDFYYTGPLANACARFLEDMRSCGLVYNAEGNYLRIIAKLAKEQELNENCLTRDFVESWVMNRDFESNKTWGNRVNVIRKLAKYMNSHGMAAYETPVVIQNKPSEFAPHIFTTDELRRIFEQADLLPSYTNCPNRGAVASVLIRMLYGCGLRFSEASGLRMKDVDLDNGVLTILNSKFNKSRYVPMSPELTQRCINYVAAVRKDAQPDMPFFPAPDGGVYSNRAMNHIFRNLLYNAGIPYTGKGPRLHDMRHTFSVHCLKKWVLEGKDVSVALPILSAYLGHKDLKGTQHYLKLTADMYPDITAKVEQCFGSVIPGRQFNEES